MDTFRTRLSRISGKNGRVILACDHGGGSGDLEARAIRSIEELHPFLCGVKLNFHLLLPLGAGGISRITGAARRHGLQAIADIKLNDIGNTNGIAAGRLWDMGFDAVIANPIMGLESMRRLAASAHGDGRGVISLCHMSAPEARLAYEMEVGPRRLYEVFLDWAIESGADGIIVGATFPEVIRRCSREARGTPWVFSPGVGAQGGRPSEALSAGSDYLIAGRGILDDPDPAAAARRMQLECFP